MPEDNIPEKDKPKEFRWYGVRRTKSEVLAYLKWAKDNNISMQEVTQTIMGLEAPVENAPVAWRIIGMQSRQAANERRGRHYKHTAEDEKKGKR